MIVESSGGDLVDVVVVGGGGGTSGDGGVILAGPSLSLILSFGEPSILKGNSALGDLLRFRVFSSWLKTKLSFLKVSVTLTKDVLGAVTIVSLAKASLRSFVNVIVFPHEDP